MLRIIRNEKHSFKKQAILMMLRNIHTEYHKIKSVQNLFFLNRWNVSLTDRRKKSDIQKEREREEDKR